MESFIYSEQISETMCDKLVKFYKDNPDRYVPDKYCKGKTIEADRQAQASAGGTNPYLFKINRSVITNMVINHDPDGVVGFHADGIPVHSRLNITFQELEYVVNEVDPISDAHKNNIRQIEATERKEAIQANIKTGGGGAPLNP